MKKGLLTAAVLAASVLVLHGCGGDKKDEKPAASSAKTLEYSYFDFKKSEQGGRLRVQARIVPEAKDNINKMTLAATCMGAAKHLASESAAKVSSVFIMDQKAPPFAMRTIATCHYAPDGGGFSGEQKWTWDGVTAADRTTTESEKKISVAWAEMRGQYQKDGVTDEDALKKAIAKKYKMKADDVHLPYVSPEKVTVTPELENVPELRPMDGKNYDWRDSCRLSKM